MKILTHFDELWDLSHFAPLKIEEVEVISRSLERPFPPVR